MGFNTMHALRLCFGMFYKIIAVSFSACNTIEIDIVILKLLIK